MEVCSKGLGFWTYQVTQEVLVVVLESICPTNAIGD